MIRVLVVDDSRTARLVLSSELARQPDFLIVGAAADAAEAGRLLAERRPDVITLDLDMPAMNGLEFLRQLNSAEVRVPVVVVTSRNERNAALASEAVRLGAVEVVGKARLGADAQASARLVAAVRAAGQAQLRRSPRPAPPQLSRTGERLIAIGASTGGTRALEQLLCGLDGELPAFVIAQHLPPAFTSSFAARLDAVTALTVTEARHSDVVRPGHVLLAPGGTDLTLRRGGGGLRVAISRTTPGRRDTPSIDALFHSVAETVGPAAIGILLTGMGRDGASGLAAMREAGACTIAEHEETAVVYGMPAAAVALGGASEIARLHDIPALIRRRLAEPPEEPYLHRRDAARP